MVIRMGFCTAISILTVAFVLDSLHFVFVSGEIETKGNCSYVVTVETTCSKDAGTSDYVHLRFGNSNNEILVHQLNTRHVKWVDPLNPNVLDDVPRRPFIACSVDEFQVDGPCVDTHICYLYLKLTGSDDWRPGFAHVRVMDKPKFNSGYFYFRRYLPRHVWNGDDLCKREHTPFGIKNNHRILH